MDIQIITVYCLCDDMLNALQHYEDSQRQMSDAEVMTSALVAMLYFAGNFETARDFLHSHGYIPAMLSKSHFNRRLHRLADLFLLLFRRLADSWHALHSEKIYDSAGKQ